MKEELLVDTYYMMNFNGLSSGQSSRVPPAGRVFDSQSNSFTMNYAKVGLEIDADPVTVRADLGYGYLGGILTGASPNTQAFVVQQAYAAVKIPGTPLTLDMGRFVTGAGAEVIEANKNWLYSRSFLFGIIPFYHTGARLTLKANDQFSAQLTVANSQMAADPDANSGKVVGLQLTITPIAPLSILATGYVGREPLLTQDPEKVTLDLVAAYTVSDTLGVNLNFDYVKWDQAHAVGVAAMAHYVAAEHLTLSARGEFLKDKGILFPPAMNAALTSESLFEGTVNAGIPFAGHFEARLELRGDFAGDPIFPGGDAGKKNQFTGTIAFLGFI